MSIYERDKYKIDPNKKLEEYDENYLAEVIRVYRNLPYTLKIERIKGNIIYCRNSWGNHLIYEYKNGNFDLLPLDENK